jgi:hypothetical protein
MAYPYLNSQWVTSGETAPGRILSYLRNLSAQLAAEPQFVTARMSLIWTGRAYIVLYVCA